MLSQSFPTGVLGVGYKCVGILIPGPSEEQGEESRPEGQHTELAVFGS